jgi:hypothetical protein
MAKKTNDPAANANNNNNSNNVNVNVNVSPARRSYNRKPKNNWLVKAIVGGIIALAVSVIGYYLTGKGETGKAAFVGNGASAVSPNQ